MRASPPAWSRLLVEGRACDQVVFPCEGILERLLGVWRYGGRLPPGLALRLTPCKSVHTLGLPRPLEVAFCDAEGRILRLVTPLPPHRLASCLGARQAWEFRVGTALRLGLRVGQRLTLGAGHAIGDQGSP